MFNFLTLSLILTSQDYPTPDVELLDEVNAEEHAVVHGILAHTMPLPPLNTGLEAERPLGKGILTLDSLDLSHLINLRRSHETQYAKKGLRTSQTNDISHRIDEKSAQRELLKEFHRFLKDARVGSGLERAARWKESTLSGNAANARIVANATAAAVRVLEIT